MFDYLPATNTNARRSNGTYLAGAVIFLITALPAWSQTTYKCGNTYSQNPCEGAIALPIEDKRTAEQKMQALTATQKEKQAADSLEQARLDKEKRELAELKKAKVAKKKASEKAAKTTVHPIKNKPLKGEPAAPAAKGAQKSLGKKPKAAADDK